MRTQFSYQKLNGDKMRKRAFYKDIFCTLRNNLSRFVAIVVMAALGTGVFTGFAAGCMDVLDSADHFYDKQKTYDIKIASTLGLTEKDLSAVSNLGNVNSAFGNCSVDVLMTQKNGKKLLANVSTLDTEGMNEPYVLDGKLPTKSGQIAVNTKFINDTGLKIGDTITLKKSTAEDNTDQEANDMEDSDDTSSSPSLAVTKYEITAVILSPLNISNTEGSIAAISLSSSSADYMMYVTKDCVKSDVYTTIYLTLDNTAAMECYSDEYRTKVADMISIIKDTIQGEREQDRYEEIVGDAKSKIAKSEQELSNKMADAEKEFADAQVKIDDGWKSYKEGLAKLKTNEAKLSEGQQALQEAKKATNDKLNNAQKELDAKSAELQASVEQLNRQEAELTKGMQKIQEGKKKLADAAAELTKGQKKLDKNKSEYENSIDKAKKKLNDAREKINNINKAKWYVWDRSENDSFDGLDNDISFIQAVTRAFPIIFFLVAILVSLTTMTRMVEEDRTLIGTYKSLGYTKHHISMKYLLYAGLACIAGGILGALFGFLALPKVIWIIVQTMYVLPTFQYSFYPVYGLGAFGMFLLGIVGATIFACAEMLHKRPAELMRPKAPKEGSRILLERIPFIWKRLKFLNKVTCRNLFRYKKRAIMTIVGIMGCMMLILLGFGVRDTVGGVMTDQFGHVTVYDAIVATNNLNTEEMNQFTSELDKSKMLKDKIKLQISKLTLSSNNENVDITVMVIPDDANFDTYVHLKDIATNSKKTLPTEGIVVTQNAAKQLKLKKGDTASLSNEDNREHDFPIAFVTTNNAGNYVYLSESCYKEAFGDYAETSLLLNLADQSKGEEWLKHLSEDDRVLYVSSSQDAIDIFGDVKKIIGMVVYLLIGMSAVLALTVLFTLSNINVSERDRELATIKVLGFKNIEVYSYVNKETFILTLIGILLGMPAGYSITYAILANVSVADIAFNVRVSVAAYLTAAILTMLFTLLVNKITNKTLRKINMVEALKSVE